MVTDKYPTHLSDREAYRALWQAYCQVRSHLKTVSKAILDDNKSGSIAVAIMSEGIIEESIKTANGEIP